MAPTQLELRCLACGAQPLSAKALPHRCPGATAGDERLHLWALDSEASGTRELRAHPEPDPLLRFRSALWASELCGTLGIDPRAPAKALRRARSALEEQQLSPPRCAELERIEDDPALAELEFSSTGGCWRLVERGRPGVDAAARARAATALHLALHESDRGVACAAVAGEERALLQSAAVCGALSIACETYLPRATPARLSARLQRLDAQRIDCPPCAPGCTDAARLRAAERCASGAARPLSADPRENALALDGLRCLGFEFADALESGAAGVPGVDHLLVPAEPAGLCEGLVLGLLEARQRGLSLPLPRVHPIVGMSEAHDSPAWQAWTQSSLGSKSRRGRRGLERLRARLSAQGGDAELWSAGRPGALVALAARTGGWPLVVPQPGSSPGDSEGPWAGPSGALLLAGLRALHAEGELSPSARAAVCRAS